MLNIFQSVSACLWFNVDVLPGADAGQLSSVVCSEQTLCLHACVLFCVLIHFYVFFLSISNRCFTVAPPSRRSSSLTAATMPILVVSHQVRV